MIRKKYSMTILIVKIILDKNKINLIKLNMLPDSSSFVQTIWLELVDNTVGWCVLIIVGWLDELGCSVDQEDCCGVNGVEFSVVRTVVAWMVDVDTVVVFALGTIVSGSV